MKQVKEKQVKETKPSINVAKMCAYVFNDYAIRKYAFNERTMVSFQLAILRFLIDKNYELKEL